MRSSRPIPCATTATSAPTSSHTFAISLMNEILVARKAFERVLDHLGADATSVRMTGALQVGVEVCHGLAVGGVETRR